MQNIIIPFIIGKGKTGYATTGTARPLIKETFNYPNSFNNLQKIIKESVNEFTNPDEAYKICFKGILKFVNCKVHISEVEFAGKNLIFVNLNLLKNVTSLTVNNE